MNIGLVIENLHAGGSERVVQRLAVGLARRGHRPYIYCLRDAGVEASELDQARVLVRTFHSHGRDLHLAARLLRQARHDGVDILHAHSCAALAWSFPAAHWLGCPLVHVRHGRLLASQNRYVRLAQYLDYAVDALVLCADSERRDLPPGLARRATHVPNGVDVPRLPRAAARAALERACGRRLPGPVVLTVGTVCPEKDTRGLLEAFGRLRRQHPQATLVCVGPERGAEYAALVRRTCQEQGLADHAVFTGGIQAAWRMMAGADVFCLASLTEAAPNVVLEAMSQGVPIVATTVGDVGQLGPHPPASALLRHEETALLVPPLDREALVAALHAVLVSPAAAAARATRATAAYEARFTADVMVRGYESVYTQCLARRGKYAGARHAQRPIRRPRVLMGGPPPGRIGGMNSVIDTLRSSSLTERYDLRRTWMNSARPGHYAMRWPGWLPELLRRADAVGRHGGAWLRLAQRLWTERIDVLHLHTCSGFSFFRALGDVAVARALGRRAVLHIHGAKFDAFCAQSRGWRRQLIRRGSEAADAVVVLSDRWRDALRSYLGRANLVVIPNGVPIGTPHVHDAKRPCRFLFLGELTRRKGIAELLAAARHLRDAAVPFELVVAGPPAAAEVDDWPARVRDWGLTDCVRFVGPVHGQSKQDLLAACDCLVLPSYHEGLPMAVLEAAAAGLAVITTQVGGLPEFARPDHAVPALDGGEHITPLLPPGDATALEKAMQRVATDVPYRRQIARNVYRRTQEEYSANCAARRGAHLYEQLLRSRRRIRVGHDWFAPLARHLTFPLYERLRERPTLAEYAALSSLSGRTFVDVEALVCDRLRALLQFAATRLPYFVRLITRHRVDVDAADPLHELRKLPLLDKATVRANLQQLCYRPVAGGLQPCATGGTTGDTLHFYVDRLRQAQDQAARLFMQGRFGVPVGARRLYLWGSPIEGRRSRLHRLRDRVINELLLNAFDMSPGQMDAHLARIRRFQPRVIYGYPTAVAALARHAAARYGPADFPALQLVVLTGEEVWPNQVEQVRRVFGVPAVSEYGNREVGLIAHECPAGGLHIIAPHLLVEVVVAGEPATPGEVGEIVCTTLNTRGQPFIRYRLGDLGALLPEGCTCGLPFPLLRLAGGKVTGFIALPDGRLCHGALSTHAIRDEVGIVEFKTWQRALDHIEILLVVDEGFQAAALDRIRARYARLFGDAVRVTCRIVDHIPPDPSGKRRHVVSDVAPDYFHFDVVAPLND